MLKPLKDFYSDETNKAICDLLDQERDNTEAFADIADERELAVANAASMSAATLTAMREELTHRKYHRHLERLELATRRHNTTLDCLEECRTQLEAARKKASKERDAATKRFKSLGITLESTRAWPDNPAAARIQFQHKLLEVASVQAADTAVQNAEALARDLAQEAKRTRPAIEQAELGVQQLADAVLK